MAFKTNHHFILVLSGVDENTDGLEDALYQAGCNDALINYRNGIVCLDFDREANTLSNAIFSAINDIENAGIDAKVSHIEGTFVTLSEIAERTNFTKQAISLFIKGKRGSGHFPAPFSGVNSTSPIWKWKEVVAWMVSNQKIQDAKIIEDAELLDNLNAVLDMRNELVMQARENLLNMLNHSLCKAVFHQD